jgi:hypothetical protein
MDITELSSELIERTEAGLVDMRAADRGGRPLSRLLGRCAREPFPFKAT